MSSARPLPTFLKAACLLHLHYLHFSVLNSVTATAVARNSNSTMVGPHLTTGSVDPPLVPGKIRIYSMRFCPFSHRAHLVLLAKNIPFDPVFINLKSKPEWYTDKVSTGKAPALLVDGQNVYESLIIADFLDENYPERPLHSKDPLKKAKDRILIEGFGGKVVGPFYRVMTDSNPSQSEFEVVVKELAAYDKELSSRGTTFFSGDKAGMLDYMIWPWFERIEMLKVLYGDDFSLPQKLLPTLTRWMGSMKEDDAVKQYYLTPEVHARFMRTYQAGNPDYDILIREQSQAGQIKDLNQTLGDI